MERRSFYRNIMQSLKRRLSIRKKKDHLPECSKPHQWQEDEKKVREGSCSFQVRYLGAVEVLDSRGMHVCEDAVKALKSQNRGKYQRAILYVSGDTLRVVDEISKSMIVDQTIEKVSFCAPDRNHEKGFAYICRDGTTRRWMCHGFLAVKESVSGERLSHAVGCAFAICLERKQKRDKETGVTVTYNQDRTSFTRTGSFRQASLTERLADPQSAILAEPVPVRRVDNPFAVQRPHATSTMLQRQGSFRGFEKLQQEGNSPFKRSVSLRLNELPSTLQRQNALAESPTQALNGAVGGPISEVSPTQEQEDSIAQMCQQLTQGLSALSSDDPFAAVPRTASLTHQSSLPPYHSAHPPLPRQHTLPATSTGHVSQPLSTNPWASPVSSKPMMDSASAWPGAMASVPSSSSATTNPFMSHSTPAGYPLHHTAGVTNGVPSGASHVPAGLASAQRPPALMQHGRSRSMDAGELSSNLWHQPPPPTRPTLLQMAQQQQHSFQQNGGVGSMGAGDMARPTSSASSFQSSSHAGPSSTTSAAPSGPGVDPFDVAWAAKAANKSNPFGSKTVSKQFEVQL